MFLRQIIGPSLAQNADLVGCQRSGEAIVIDPERDLDRYRHRGGKRSPHHRRGRDMVLPTGVAVLWRNLA